jgi:acetyl esterase
MPVTNRAAVITPRWKEQVIDIEGRPPLAARLYAATFDAGKPVALVLHLHGGSFVGGSLDQGTAVASLLARAGATVLSIAYPLAPEHPFPNAVEAAHAALGWAQRHRRRLVGAAVPLIVAGEEAGGNLAAAVALVARDRHGPALAGQILLSPMLDLCVASASWRDALAGRAGQCPWADGWRAYLPRACDALHPYAAPSRSMRLHGLPPTLLITSQDDPMRDEALAYAQRLREADVPLTQAVLTLATGWPGSYLHATAASPAAPWTEAVLVHLQRFLREYPKAGEELVEA